MPVAAVLAIGVGAGALIGGVTGFAALAAVGAVVGGVGALVDDKDLAKIGGVMGLAGGVGAWGASNGLWSDLSTVARTEGGNIQTMLSQGQQQTTGQSGGLMETSGVAESPVVAAAADKSVVAQSLEKTQGLMGGGDQVSRMAAENYAIAGPEGVNKLGESLAFADKATGSTNFLDAIAGKFESVSKWADDHKIMSAAILQGVGKIGEQFTDKNKAEIEKDKAMADLYGARASAEQTSLINANAVPALDSRFGLKPGLSPFKNAPTTYTRPQFGGLMTRTA